MYEIPKHNNCSADEHRAILDAIEQGDEKRATQLMEDHLEHYATTFIEENSTVSAEQNLLNLSLYTTNFIGPLSYQAFSFLKLLALS